MNYFRYHAFSEIQASSFEYTRYLSARKKHPPVSEAYGVCLIEGKKLENYHIRDGIFFILQNQNRHGQVSMN